jgi:hypothetical protein
MTAQASPQATPGVLPAVSLPAETQTPRPADNLAGTAASEQGTPVVDPLLFVHATAHSDIENLRIATQHRHRILTTREPDDDGVIRGFGLTDGHPDVIRLASLLAGLEVLEHEAELNLKRVLRRCSIHPWVKAQCGLGDKQVARLLGAIGDPYWHLAEDRPRTVSQLWAYSGLHVLPVSPCRVDTPSPRADGDQTSDPDHRLIDGQFVHVGVAAKRRKGVRANWSTEAKTRAYLCATSCIKQERSPYRAVYLSRREHTAVTHPEWTPGHSHNDGLRIASKAILRDLWREARRLHERTTA